GGGRRMTETQWLTSRDPEAMLNGLRNQTSRPLFRLVAVACARAVAHLFPDPLYHTAIDVTERFLDGHATSSDVSKVVAAMRRHPATFARCYFPGHAAPPAFAPAVAKEAAAFAALYATVEYDRPSDWRSSAVQVAAIAAVAEAAEALTLRGPEIVPRLVENTALVVHQLGPEAYTNFFRFYNRGRGEGVIPGTDPDGTPENGYAVLAAYALARRRQADLVRDVFGNPFRPVNVDPRWLTSTVVDLARTAYENRTFELLPVLADALQDAGCEDQHILTHCRQVREHVRGCWVVDLLLGKSQTALRRVGRSPPPGCSGPPDALLVRGPPSLRSVRPTRRNAPPAARSPRRLEPFQISFQISARNLFRSD